MAPALTVPPSTNRGVVNTSEPSALEFLIDWCAFTVPDSEAYQKVISFMDLIEKDFVAMPKGALGYMTHKRSGNISVFSEGNQGMGIHVVMSGKGCRQFDSLSGKWREFFNMIFSVSGHFCRVDVAIDDRVGLLSLDQISAKIDSREIRCRSNKSSQIKSRDLCKSSDSDGKTEYLGSSKSDFQIRFYDKAAEQKVEGHWVRVEMQCRRERADVLAGRISNSDNLGAIISGVLKNYVSFVEPSEDSNKSRWPVSSWWSAFLGNVERLQLTIKKLERTIEQVKQWVNKQVAPSLALVFKFIGGDFDYFDQLISDGEKRLKPRHFAMLQST